MASVESGVDNQTRSDHDPVPQGQVDTRGRRQQKRRGRRWLGPYPPLMPTSALMILALWNTSTHSLTVEGLARVIGHMFPYYKKKWPSGRPRTFLDETNTGTYASCFLRHCRRSHKLVVVLNHAEEVRWKTHLKTSITDNESQLRRHMVNPDLLDVLKRGEARLDDVGMSNTAGNRASCVMQTGPTRRQKQHGANASVARGSVGEYDGSDESMSDESGTSSSSRDGSPEILHVGNKNVFCRRKKQLGGKISVAAASGDEVFAEVMSVESGTGTVSCAATSLSTVSQTHNKGIISSCELVQQGEDWSHKLSFSNGECNGDNLDDIFIQEGKATRHFCVSHEESMDAGPSQDMDEKSLPDLTFGIDPFTCFSPEDHNQVTSKKSIDQEENVQVVTLTSDESDSSDVEFIESSFSSFTLKSLLSLNKTEPGIDCMSTSGGTEHTSVPHEAFDIMGSNHVMETDITRGYSYGNTVSIVRESAQDSMQLNSQYSVFDGRNTDEAEGKEPDSSADTGVMKEEFLDSVPEVTSIIHTWRKIFPWVTLRGGTNCFVCILCYIDNMFTRNTSHNVFTVMSPSHVYSVARHLKNHHETSKHKKNIVWRELLNVMAVQSYLIVKSFNYSNMAGIVNQLSAMGNESFTSLTTEEKVECVRFFIKYFAAAIESDLITLLSRSTTYSIVDLQDLRCAVIRWLSPKGNAEEHFFVRSDAALWSRLQEGGIDETRLLSRSSFPVLYYTLNASVQTPEIPLRIPTTMALFHWLERTELLGPLFTDLDSLVGNCKAHPSKFSQFPAVGDMLRVTEPYGYCSIISENIMAQFFKYAPQYEKIIQTIYTERGRQCSFRFTADLHCYSDVLQKFAFDVAKLWRDLNAQNLNIRLRCIRLRKYRERLLSFGKRWKKMSPVLEVLHILDTYVAEVITILESPGNEYAKLFQVKMNEITADKLQPFLDKLKMQYQGGSSQYLQDVLNCQRVMCLSGEDSLSHVITTLQKRVDLHHTFHALTNFTHQMASLPFFVIQAPRHRFSLAACFKILKKKMKEEDELLHPLALIYFEGPAHLNQSSLEEFLNACDDQFFSLA